MRELERTRADEGEPGNTANHHLATFCEYFIFNCQISVGFSLAILFLFTFMPKQASDLTHLVRIHPIIINLSGFLGRRETFIWSICEVQRVEAADRLNWRMTHLRDSVK